MGQDGAAGPGTGHDNRGYIGYCVCSVSADKTGEVESFFVEAPYRLAGIGTTLLTRGLAGMDTLGAVRK